MKRLFSTPKKAIILVICMVVVIIAASVIAFKSTLITKAEAKIIALKDADLSEAEASALRTRLEFDDGRFQYEVDFYSNGTEYEYIIQAKNGEIIARDIDGKGNGNNDMQDTGNQFAADENSSVQPQKDAENQSDKKYDYEINASNGTVLEKNIEQFQIQTNPTDSTINNSSNDYIGVDRAKEIALNHAQLSESDVHFAKAKLENDDDGVEYEIEFYSGRTEYDYTIDAVSGNIIEYDVDYD